jgi:hypothetical protein
MFLATVSWLAWAAVPLATTPAAPATAAPQTDLSATLWAFPATSRYVMSLDVVRFTRSPFYRNFVATGRVARPLAFTALRDQAALDPEWDIKHLFVAGGPQGEPALTAAHGRFDVARIRRALAVQSGRARPATDLTPDIIQRPGRPPLAWVVLNSEWIVFGTPAVIEEFLANRAQKKAALRANTTLVPLLEQISMRATFWFAGDRSVLSQVSFGKGGSQGQIPPLLDMPQLQYVAMQADLEPTVNGKVTGILADPGSAKTLADALRAVILLSALQKPELKALSQQLTIETGGNRTLLQARLPYETIEALIAKRPAAPALK